MKVIIYTIISLMILSCVSTNTEQKFLTGNGNSISQKTLSKIPREKCSSKNDCIQSIFRNVAMRWVRPDRVKEGVSVKIRITVDSEGYIKDKTIVESSGSNNFDISCIRAIERSSPFVEIVQFNSLSEKPKQKIYFNFTSKP
jgi:TonB family protein